MFGDVLKNISKHRGEIVEIETERGKKSAVWRDEEFDYWQSTLSELRDSLNLERLNDGTARKQTL